MILDKIVAIQRLTDDTDNTDKEQYRTNEALQAVKCQLQVASPGEAAIVEGVYGQTYIMYTTESGVLEGDKVTVSGTGDIMRVKGVEDWSIDPMSHFELTLVAFEEERV